MRAVWNYRWKCRGCRSGEEALLDQLLEQCKLGPTYSKVASADVQREAVGEKFLDFEIRR